MSQLTPSSPINELYQEILALDIPGGTKDRLLALWLAASNSYEERYQRLKAAEGKAVRVHEYTEYVKGQCMLGNSHNLMSFERWLLVNRDNVQ